MKLNNPSKEVKLDDSLLELMQAMESVQSSSMGYCNQLYNIGFSEETSEAMASQYHGFLLHMILKNKSEA